jgi:hypothetical protein
MPLTCDTHPGENTIEIVVAGTITETDVRVATEKVKGFLDRHAEINVIEIVRDHAGTDPATLWSGPALGQGRSRVRRVAVVSDAGWQRPISDDAADVRSFPMDQIDAARLWAHRGP